MAAKRSAARRQRGRPPGAVPIERDPQRYEIAAWRAFVGMGLGQFDAARRALLAVKGGPITIEDVEGVLRLASAEIPLPPPNPDEPDAGLRRLAAKAKRQKPSKWLDQSAGLIQGLILYIDSGNVTGASVTLDALDRLGWRPVLVGLARRIETALQSNLPPADLEKLSPAARRLLAELRGGQKK
jgi:hypothetical protein